MGVVAESAGLDKAPKRSQTFLVRTVSFLRTLTRAQPLVVACLLDRRIFFLPFTFHMVSSSSAVAAFRARNIFPHVYSHSPLHLLPSIALLGFGH